MDGALVNNLESYDKKRDRVDFDDGYSCLLYKGEVKRFNIKEGAFLDSNTLFEIRESIINKRAKARCLHLLEKRRYTEKQLYDKLIKGGYDRYSASQAIEYAKSFHYVDDSSFAYDYIEIRWGRESRDAVAGKLLNKGISRDVIEAAFEAYLEENDKPDEGLVIRGLLEKKGYSKDQTDPSDKRRIYAFLLRRGFSSESILREMDTFDTDVAFQ